MIENFATVEVFVDVILSFVHYSVYLAVFD